MYEQLSPFGILLVHGFSDEDARTSAEVITSRLPRDWRAALSGLSMKMEDRHDFFRQLFGSDAMRAAEVLWRAARATRMERTWGGAE